MANIAVSLNSLTVGTSSLSPISSINTVINEQLYVAAFDIVTSTRQNVDIGEVVSVTTGITAMPTYTKTDGVPITTGTTSGGTYWVTG